MTDPRVAKLRAKAADSAVTEEEAKLLRDKADELEAKDAARVPDFPPAPPSFPTLTPAQWFTVIRRTWDEADIVEARYRYDEDEVF